MSDDQKRLARAAFFAGFGISGEGWNAEYPFENKPVEDLQKEVGSYFETWFEKVGAQIADSTKSQSP